jgi:hypothetical protein
VVAIVSIFPFNLTRGESTGSARERPRARFIAPPDRSRAANGLNSNLPPVFSDCSTAAARDQAPSRRFGINCARAAWL